MCMVEDSDGDYEAVTTTVVLNETQHCYECGRIVAVGDEVDMVQGYDVTFMNDELPEMESTFIAHYEPGTPYQLLDFSQLDRATLAWNEYVDQWYIEREAARRGGLVDDERILVPTGPPFYRCPQCVAASRWLVEICGGYLYGGVQEDLDQHLDEEYRCRSLVVLVGLMGKKWTYGGKLTPVRKVDGLVTAAVAYAESIGGKP